jgi:hypothetical protein
MQALATVSYMTGVVLLALTFFPFSPMTLKLWMPRRETMLFAHRNRYFLRGLGTLGLALTFFLGAQGFAAPGWSWAAVLTGVFFAFFWWSGYVPVVMGYPREQRLLSGREADAILEPEDDVLGVVVDGETRAYSRTAITRPHLYYDTVGGTPLTITYCILCNSGIVFKSELEGRPLHLKPITAFNNNIIYYDQKSGNYIQQMEGKVIAGPEVGKQLSLIPVIITSWKAWKELYPNTKVLYVRETKLRDRMLTWMLSWMIPLPGLMQRQKPWHPLKGDLDEKLPAMAPVFGVEVGEERKAYPLSVVRSRGVINDTVGRVPIVVLYDTELDTGSVFARQVDGRALSFRSSPKKGSRMVAVDEETRSLWDVMGKAREGSLAGKELTPLPHFGKVFWFSWAAFRPGTKVETGAAVIAMKKAVHQAG